MKSTLVSTPNSSVKSSSSSSTTIMESEIKDSSFYFPGCRKDTNCNCEICIASFNATLDLMPNNSTITKRSAAKPLQQFPRSPISFDPSTLSTPKSSNKSSFASSSMSPPMNSTARMNFHEKVKRKKREFGYGVLFVRLVFGLSVVFGLEFGFSWMVSEFLQPELSPEIVKNLSEKTWGFNDLNERLMFFKKELEGLVDEEISSCSPLNSTWKINQDGLLLNSRCTLYKSITEELSIWGWPLQTAGLLTAGFSARSYAILSGRLTEWPNGEIGYLIRKSNSSWTQQKWSASAVQLDPNTWILEYSKSPLTENGKLVSAALEFLKFRLLREVQKLKQEFWLLSASTSQYSDFTIERPQIPT